VDGPFYDACTLDQRTAIDWINSNLYASHRIDSYAIVRWPDGHPLFWYGEYYYAYWMRQWGFSQSDVVKGIAVVELPRSDL
jgi:hypothetical protein